MSTEDPGYVCVVCGRVLEEVRLNGKLYLRHSLLSVIEGEADHPPVAAPATDVEEQTRLHCDFCSGEPVTHVLALDHEVGMPQHNIQWDSEWAMCSGCADLVLLNDWLNLRRRFFVTNEKYTGPLDERTKTDIRVAMAEVRRAVVMIYLYDAPGTQVAGE